MSKIAIITGASKGIGKASAECFINSGWQVINLSRTECDIENVYNIKIDLANDQLQTKLKKDLAPILKASSKICIVHNSCAYFSGAADNTNVKSLTTSFKVNVLAPTIINKIVIPFMLEGSSILYIGSTLSEMGIKNCLPYVVSKHAVVGLMRSTCQDISIKGIHTCCICPGFTYTETFDKHSIATGRSINEIKNKVAMQRLIHPKEVANFIFYCTNNAIVNGSVLHANLGSINY